MKKILLSFILLLLLTACSIVKYDNVVFQCYSDELKSEVVSVMYFNDDRVVSITQYRTNYQSEVVEKESSFTYSKTNDSTYVIHGDSDGTYKVVGERLYTENPDDGFCYLQKGDLLNE